MKTFQGQDTPLEISTDGGTTYKILVCVENYNINTSLSVNEKETFCGIATGVGVPKFSVSGSAVCELAPTVSQVTYKDLLAKLVTPTVIQFRIQAPVVSPGTIGATYYHQGDCYVTALDLQSQTSQTQSFTFTLTGTGVLDITP